MVDISGLMGLKLSLEETKLENNFLLHLKGPDEIVMEASNVKGPITLIQGKIEEEAIKFAAKVTLRYSDALKSQGKVLYGKEFNDLSEKLIVEKATQELLIPFLL